MKCRFVLDQDVNPATMPESERAKTKIRPAKVRNLNGRLVSKIVSYFPAGTEYDHPNAAFFVINGQAIPADKECEDAVKAEGMTEGELQQMQYRYKRQSLGLTPDDVALYDNGVIKGYDKTSPDGYAHGPKWDEYQAALKEIQIEEDDE